MTHSRDRTPTSPEPVPEPKRRPVAQRMLLATTLLFGCLALIATIARMPVPGLLTFAVALVAFSQLLAGVQKKPGRRERQARSGFWSRPFSRKRPDDPDAPAPTRPGREGGEPGTDEAAGLAPGKGSLPPDPGPVPAMEPMPVPAAGAAAPPRSGLPPWDKPAPPVAVKPVTPAEPAYLLPDPPVFAGTSAPGQAPWHLPVGTAPSGLAADAARLGDLEVRAASMVGAGHRCEEPAGPRQDAYTLGRTPDGQFLIIAVADGVSQSPRSDLGARVAVSAATRELVRMLASGGMQAIDAQLLYNVVVGEMLGTGRDRGLQDEDICSILIVAVIPAAPRPDGTRPMWASWIGDVSLWIHRDGVLRRATGREKEGLDRNALDAVLPFNPDRAEQHIFQLAPWDRVAIMTDGLSDSLSSLAGAAQFFARQWASPAPHPAAFLHSLCYDGPGQTDDRTAVVVWCGATRSAGTATHGGGRPT